MPPALARPLRHLAGLALGLAAAGMAAQGEETCPRFFPDVGCERRVRPPGSVMPMSFPFLFEDPYIVTGTNAIGLWQRTPTRSLLGGGELGLLALQMRIAVTERLALVVTKDGGGWVDSDAPLLRDAAGLVDVTAGFKVAVLRWQGERRSAIVTPSLRYEIPLGHSDVYHDGGDGDGSLLPALSAAFQEGRWHVVGALGAQLGLDDDVGSRSLFYNLHVDHAFPWAPQGLRFVVPFVSVNGLHYVRSGRGRRVLDTREGRLPLAAVRARLGLAPFEGADLANLGAAGIAGADLVTLAGGLRLPVGEGLILGASYERPVSRREDLWEHRIALMITWER